MNRNRRAQSRSRSRDERDRRNIIHLVKLAKGGNSRRKKLIQSTIGEKQGNISVNRNRKATDVSQSQSGSRHERARSLQRKSSSNRDSKPSSSTNVVPNQADARPQSFRASIRSKAKRAFSSPPKQRPAKSDKANNTFFKMDAGRGRRFERQADEVKEDTNVDDDYDIVMKTKKNPTIMHIVDEIDEGGRRADDAFMHIPLPSPKTNRSKSITKTVTKEPDCSHIQVVDNALAMNECAIAKFADNKNTNNKTNRKSNKFQINVTTINPRLLGRDGAAYEKSHIMKQLKLNKWSLTSTARGASNCWDIFHSIINSKNEVVDKYSFCSHCNKVFYKGHSTANLLKHYKETSVTRQIKKNQATPDRHKSYERTPLNEATKQELRTSTTFMVNATFSSFNMVNNKQWKDHCQSLIDAGAKHGSFDVESLEITPYKIKNTTKTIAKSIVSTQAQMISEICNNNVLPPLALTADIYGDKHLQRANIGVAAFIVADYEIKELSLGVIPMDSIKEYIIKHGGSDECYFDEEEYINDGDEANPGGYKTIIFFDEEGAEHRIKLTIKNWMNIQNALRRIINLFGIKNQAKEIFELVCTTDKGGNIRLALIEWLFFVGLICMAHRVSTCCKTALKLTRESYKAFDRMYKGCSSLINVINKSSWRAKMNPSLKSVVPTRFWGNESMFASVIANYERMKEFADQCGHEEKIRFHKNSAVSFYRPLANIKSLIKQIECRKYPTMHLFLPSITTLHNLKLKPIDGDATYAQGFKRKARAQIESKVIPGIVTSSFTFLIAPQLFFVFVNNCFFNCAAIIFHCLIVPNPILSQESFVYLYSFCIRYNVPSFACCLL